MSALKMEIVGEKEGKTNGVELVSMNTHYQDTAAEESYENKGYEHGCSIESTKQTRELVVAVLGTGFYGKALADRFHASGIDAVVGSRRAVPADKDGKPHTDYQDACEKADIVILAIPRHAYDMVVPPLRDILRGKIVMDISNRDKITDDCNALYLASLIPQSHVAKALNTLSAWSLEHDIFGSSRDTYVCCNHQPSKLIVMDLMRDIGLHPVDQGRLPAANHVEKLPLRLFPEWKFSIALNVVVLVIISTYHFIRRFAAEKIDTADHIALHEANYIFCWQAITLFALVYLPGNIASVIQLIKGTKYMRFPKWLDCWMKARKQIGLTALMFAAMHACASILLLASGYVFRMVRHIPINGNPGLTMQKYFTWNGEVSLLCAILAMTTFTILGITSLPSVNARMSWREWDFVQSFMGYLGLSFAIVHVFVYSHNVYKKDNFKFYPWDMPPSVFFMPLLPSFVVAFKFVLLLPCLRYRLIRIRSGRYNNSSLIGSCCC